MHQIPELLLRNVFRSNFMPCLYLERQWCTHSTNCYFGIFVIKSTPSDPKISKFNPSEEYSNVHDLSLKWRPLQMFFIL